MSNFPLEIDTKGTCLLCLKPKSVFKRNRGSDGDPLNSRTTTAFKMLLRYLKVDVVKLTHLTTSSVKSFGSGSENVNLLVTLCEECSSIATNFLELFQTFEKIQLQMDMCVHQLQEGMEKGAQDERRVREYNKRMSTGDRKDLMNDNMATSLRNETLAKASSKLSHRSVPQVALQKIIPKSETSDQELEAVEVERKYSTRTRSRTSFPGHEAIPTPSLDVKLEAEANWSDEGDNENDPIPMVIESTSEGEEDHEEDINSDVSSCPDDDNGGSDATDNQSNCEPEDDDDDTEKVTLAPKRCPRKTPLFKVELDLAIEKYYDKSRKCIRWKCNLCGDTFTGKQNLEMHKLGKHMMTVIKDKLPNVVPEKRVTLALNRITEMTPVISKNRYGSPKYECPFCKKKEWTSMIRIHMLQYHLDKVIEELEDCKGIEMDAPAPVRRRRKIKYSKKPKPAKPKPASSESRILKFKCDKCGVSLPSALAVKQHKMKKHPEADKYLQCDYCERPFTQPYTLRVHLIRKHPAAFFEDRLPPGISDEGFNEAMQCILDYAKDIGNSNEGEDPKSKEDCILECPYCGKRSSQYNDQTAHNQLTGMRLHIANSHLDEVIEEATRGGLNISSDNDNPHMKRETERTMYAEVNPEDIKVVDVENVGVKMKDGFNKLSPNKNQSRSPAKKVARLLHKSDQRVSNFWKIQQKHNISKSDKKCDHCGMNFRQKQSLQAHMFRKHTMIVLKDLLPPAISKEDVMKSWDMIIAKTEKRHDPGRQRTIYDCMFCNRELIEYRVHLLENHLTEVVDQIEDNRGDPSVKTSIFEGAKRTKTNHKCRICTEYFLSQPTLRVHIAEKHPKYSGSVEDQSFICQYCNKCFSGSNAIKSHLTLEHPVAYYAACMPSGVTDHDFKDVVSLMVDKMLEIGKSKGTFSCIHCDKGFNNKHKSAFRLHFAHVHLNKVLEELKRRKESLVDAAGEKSSDNRGSEDQIQEQSCEDAEDMDCGMSESGSGS